MTKTVPCLSINVIEIQTTDQILNALRVHYIYDEFNNTKYGLFCGEKL